MAARSNRPPSLLRLVQARTAIPTRYSLENRGFTTVRLVRARISSSIAMLSAPVRAPQSNSSVSKVFLS